MVVSVVARYLAWSILTIFFIVTNTTKMCWNKGPFFNICCGMWGSLYVDLFIWLIRICVKKRGCFFHLLTLCYHKCLPVADKSSSKEWWHCQVFDPIVGYGQKVTSAKGGGRLDCRGNSSMVSWRIVFLSKKIIGILFCKVFITSRCFAACLRQKRHSKLWKNITRKMYKKHWWYGCPLHNSLDSRFHHSLLGVSFNLPCLMVYS